MNWKNKWHVVVVLLLSLEITFFLLLCFIVSSFFFERGGWDGLGWFFLFAFLAPKGSVFTVLNLAISTKIHFLMKNDKIPSNRFHKNLKNLLLILAILYLVCATV